MNIAVCVKWVPVVARTKFDPETKRIVREGVPSELNGYDVLSVQRAVELRESQGGEITVYTMGPPQAREGLTRCLAMGADRAVHLVDLAFAGSDTLATSRVLAAALAMGNYDLIMFGYFSVDAETAQVGPEVAELLGLPQITGASKLDVDGSTVRAERLLDEGSEVVEAQLPVVVSVAEGVAAEVFPGRDEIRAAAERDVPELGAADIGVDPATVGSAGSPTWVSEIRILESAREKQVIEEMAPSEAARQVADYLQARGTFEPERREARRDFELAPQGVREAATNQVWVVAEFGPGGVRPVTYELLAAAQPIADAIGGSVAAIVMGGLDREQYAEELAHYGADVVATACGEALATYWTEAYAATLAAAIEERKPHTVLVPSSANGRDLAGRVAARLGLGLTGDCVGLEVDEQGRLVQLKPAFGGNVVAPIFSRTLPNMATVRQGVVARLAPNAERVASLLALEVQAPAERRVRHIEMRPAASEGLADLDSAWAVIAIGKGVGGPEFISELDPLRDLLGAEYVCTRDVADAGWMPKQLQVGLTGRSIAPELYIGVGLRGDFNHLVGLQRAGVIVGVNNNRRTSLFRVADIAVHADWHEFIPELTAALRPMLS